MEEKKIILSVEADTSGATAEINELGNNLDKVSNTNLDKPFKNFKQELRAATEQAQNMAREFGKNSEQFTTAAKKVANLNDEFAEFNLTVDAFNPDNKFQGLVSLASGAIGAIQGVAGAMTLMGVESEDAQKTIAKLQALMSLSDALNQYDNIASSVKNLGSVIKANTVFQKANNATTVVASTVMKAFGVSVKGTSLGFKVLKGAIISTGIGALVIGLVALIQNFDAVKRTITNLIPGFGKIADGIGKVIDKIKIFVGATTEAEIAQDSLSKSIKRNIEDQEEYLKLNSYRLNEYQKKVSEKGIQYQKDIDEISTKYVNDKVAKDKKILEYTKTFNAEIDLLGKESIAKDAATKKEGEDKQTAIRKEGQSKRDALKEAEKAKSKADAEEKQRELEAELAELAKIELESNKKITDSKLTEREKELNDLVIDFNEKKAKYKKHGNDISAITEEYNINRKAIEKKYSDDISQLIEDATLNDYDKQRKAINDKYEDAIKKASDFKQKLILAGLQSDETLKVDTEETNKKNTINAETNVINTEIDNAPNEKDTVEIAKLKLQNIFNAEQEQRTANYNAELAALGNNEEEKKNLTAKYNQQNLDAKNQLAKSEKEIDDAKHTALIGNINSYINAADAVVNLIGKNTVAGKAVAVAKATMDTYQGIAAGVKLGFPAAIPAVAMAAATGFAAVKNILKVKVPGPSGGSGTSTAPTIQAPTINSTLLNPSATVQDVRVTNNQDQVFQTYISNRDLQTREEKTAFLNKVNSF